MNTLQIQILEKINSPEDVKKLSIEEMNVLADEIRQCIVNRVDKIGGHLGPDLGIVEATIALHYVFNSPVDKFVFDVSHQCYPHKILTGRKEGFTNPLEHGEISGYFNFFESKHDPFIIGHTSTSVSLATGLAKARDLKGEKYNVIALIGDGSLSGGEAFEGFNNSSVLNSNFIIIVNDNEMSIAENQGGLYKNLKELRESSGNCPNNWFKAFGFDYKYVENGNDITSLINAFNEVKDIDHPIVIHIHTLKGKGFEPAEKNKEWGHWAMPGILSPENNTNTTATESYESITKDYILSAVKYDSSIIAINAATPGVFGWNKEFREALGKNYTDVGIAEQHACAYSSGLATNSAKPIWAVHSSFIQRTYDQLSQDLALNNSPATILVFWSGITSADVTHLGLFDIPLISNIPNIVYLAPTCKEEYLKMLDWSVKQNKHPVAIRVPYLECISSGQEDLTDYSKLNNFEVVHNGTKVAIIAAGDFFKLGKEVCEELMSKLNIDATLINPKFISGIDGKLLESLKFGHEIVITLENGILAGGFGEKISRFYGNSNMKVLNYGAQKEFTDRVPLEKLYERYRLKKELILEDIEAILNKKSLLQKRDKYRIVCLGTFCLPRVITTMCELKPRRAEGEKTCPFDMSFCWSFKGILDILDSEFKTFFDDVEYDYFKNEKIKTDLFRIFATKFSTKVWKHEKAGIYFNHEGNIDRNKFVEIYSRRINNLYEYLKDNSRKLYTVISTFEPITQEQILKLNSVIERYRPEDSYENIIINLSPVKSEVNITNTKVIDFTDEGFRKMFRSYWVKVLEQHYKWPYADKFYNEVSNFLKKNITSN